MYTTVADLRSEGITEYQASDDRLLSLIRNRDGSGADIPAVGFALWLDRLERGAG